MDGLYTAFGHGDGGTHGNVTGFRMAKDMDIYEKDSENVW